MTLTAERLRDLLSYELETGILRWRKSFRRAVAGATAGCPHGNGYIQIMVDKQKFFAHRLAWFHQHGVWPVDQIDHINGDRSDNRLCNLREATCSQNAANQRRRSDSTSGFKGVSFNKRKDRWRAYIRPDGHQHHLGYFLTKEAAHDAYKKAALQLFGEFAYGAVA